MKNTRQIERNEKNIEKDNSYATGYRKKKTKPFLCFVVAHENKIYYLVNVLKIKKFKLLVHPYIAAFINQGFIFNSLKWKWKLKYGFSFSLIPSQDLAFLQYQFLDNNGHEIDLKEEIDTLGGNSE